MKLLTLLIFAIAASALPTPSSDSPTRIARRGPYVHHEIAVTQWEPLTTGESTWATWQPGDPVDKRSLDARRLDQPWAGRIIDVPKLDDGFAVGKREAEAEPYVHHEIAVPNSEPLVQSDGPYKNPFATWQPGDPVDK